MGRKGGRQAGPKQKGKSVGGAQRPSVVCQTAGKGRQECSLEGRRRHSTEAHTGDGEALIQRGRAKQRSETAVSGAQASCHQEAGRLHEAGRCNHRAWGTVEKE